jgi:hypothetical protein
MRDRRRAKQCTVRGQHTNTPFDEGLADVVRGKHSALAQASP